MNHPQKREQGEGQADEIKLKLMEEVVQVRKAEVQEKQVAQKEDDFIKILLALLVRDFILSIIITILH